MKVLKILLGIVAVLAVAVLGGGYLLPDRVHVERSIVIDAHPATVFTVLNGFRQFNRWSPWADLDPKTQYSWSGPLTGVGAGEAWTSENPDVGNGSQEIAESVPFTRIRNKLTFGDFASENWATYTLTPQGQGTQVTWAYDSEFHGNLMYRYFGAMAEKMLGPDYDKGLARLKAFVETLPKDDFSDLSTEIVETKAAPIAFAPGEGVADEAGPIFTAQFAKIMAFIGSAHLTEVAAPMAITREFDESTKFWKFDVAVPVDQPCTSTPESEVQCGLGYAGTAIRVIHKGPYAALGTTYKKLMAFKAAAGFKDNGKSWEQYMNEPATTPEPELLTHIYWPIQ